MPERRLATATNAYTGAGPYERAVMGPVPGEEYMPVPKSDRAWRPERRRSVALALVVSLASTIAMVATPGSGPATAAPAVVPSAAPAGSLGFTVQLGPEERLIGPTGYIDVPYFSERNAKRKLFGIGGTSRPMTFKSRNNARLTGGRLIKGLDRGPAGSFDECGVWLMSIQKISRRHWLGFYHAENKGGAATCNHIEDTTVWRMGLAETTNGGKSWQKKGVILTGTNATATTGTTHAGNGRVVKLGSWYYMLFQTAHGRHPENPGVYVARAPVSAKGRGWQKYYCHPATTLPHRDAYCAFDEPGVEGKSTKISGLGEKARYVSWNTALQRWIGLDASGRHGFTLYASDQPTGAQTNENVLMKWAGSTEIYPLVSNDEDTHVDQWGGSTRGITAKQLYAYPSILGADGNSFTSGNTFYIYYMKLFPGDKFDRRYLFRRKATLKIGGSDQLNRVALTTYLRKSDGRRRTTTERPELSAFKPRGTNGYMLAEPLDGFRQVFECSKRGDYLLRANKCGRGERAYRRVGYLSATENNLIGATVPIYRCFDKAKKNHYAQRDGCRGAKKDGRLGYGFEPL